MLIKTKSVSDPIEQADGERILVTRYWPRGRTKEKLSISEWLRDVAPSSELVQDWKDNSMSWREYVKRYKREMASQQEAIASLAEKAREKTITLLCFEPEEDPHCHRHLLKKMVEMQMGK